MPLTDEPRQILGKKAPIYQPITRLDSDHVPLRGKSHQENKKGVRRFSTPSPAKFWTIQSALGKIELVRTR